MATLTSRIDELEKREPDSQRFGPLSPELEAAIARLRDPITPERLAEIEESKKHGVIAYWRGSFAKKWPATAAHMEEYWADAGWPIRAP